MKRKALEHERRLKAMQLQAEQEKQKEKVAKTSTSSTVEIPRYPQLNQQKNAPSNHHMMQQYHQNNVNNNFQRQQQHQMNNQNAFGYNQQQQQQFANYQWNQNHAQQLNQYNNYAQSYMQSNQQPPNIHGNYHGFNIPKAIYHPQSLKNVFNPNAPSKSPPPPHSYHMQAMSPQNIAKSAPPPDTKQMHQIQQHHNKYQNQQINQHQPHQPSHNHLVPVSGGYGNISAPKFDKTQLGVNDESDSENENISKWDPRRSSVMAGHLKTTTKEDILESRRKSVFDESSSEEADFENTGNHNNGRRLTVNLHQAKNYHVNGNVANLNKYS